MVVYWMSRDQRVRDNWALLRAYQTAREQGLPLSVLFCLADSFQGATERQYDFMLRGLMETEGELNSLNIPLVVLRGEPGSEIGAYINRKNVSLLVTDFDPLRIKRKWQNDVRNNISIPFEIVDAHNIVPVREVSPKQEWAAYTLRKKIHKLLPDYLTPMPTLKRFKNNGKIESPDWKNIRESLQTDKSVPPVTWLKPGTAAAIETLREFIDSRLERYHLERNDPNKNALSNLSPYLHFGQISALKIALEVKKATAPKEAKEAFLEELIVRRELADNFCYYNPDYDSTAGFPDWAKRTLDDHRGDKREYLYSREEFDQGKTHDDLWNAAQMEMTKTGKMHGYMRMYWAKKIMEWSASPEEAMETSIYLNDRYELDGRDPNGYTGIAWSIGGVHDRPWPERKIFGKVRWMALSGMKRKFDIDKYIATHGNKNGLKQEKGK